ncbi:hypothetical protein APHNP_0732 [Anaplasma phagocytophilum str. ApNP]|uniref:Uncharacterized protein n=1 Tax=Anaplasma phagocytophilum str. ApNP TaxID=1359153 RepID=A0A0F3NEQ7_ANAPH|nr:hypothetical protein APHNP_0732 [Anaplasma phagocytophilum str. ApNP]
MHPESIAESMLYQHKIPLKTLKCEHMYMCNRRHIAACKIYTYIS